MTVGELITWLQTQDQAAKVVLHDPDTEWFLDLKTGVQAHYDESEKPPGTVAVHAEY